MKDVNDIEFNRLVREKVESYEVEYQAEDWQLFEQQLSATKTSGGFRFDALVRKLSFILRIRFLSVILSVVVSGFIAYAYLPALKTADSNSFNWQLPVQQEERNAILVPEIRTKRINQIETQEIKVSTNLNALFSEVIIPKSVIGKENVITLKNDSLLAKTKPEIEQSKESEIFEIQQEKKSQKIRIYKLEDVDESPKFYDGWSYQKLKKLEKYIQRNTDYKIVNETNAKNRRLRIWLQISAEGELTNLKIYPRKDTTLTNEIIRIINTLDDWKPASINENPVSTKTEIKVRLKTKENKPFPSF